VLVAALTFSVAAAAVPTLVVSDDDDSVEVQGVVVAPGADERARGPAPAVVVPAPAPDAPPLWFFPTIAALMAFLGVTGVAATKERNPPARFDPPWGQ